jgi:hypothetical protein
MGGQRKDMAEMDELERIVKEFRASVETARLKHQVTNPADVLGFMNDVRTLRLKYLREIRIIRIDNRGRHMIEEACERAELQIGRIAKETVDEASKLGRVVVAGAA